MNEIYHILKECELLYTEAATVLPAVTLQYCQLCLFLFPSGLIYSISLRVFLFCNLFSVG